MSLMKKLGELGMACDPNEDGFDGGMRCSNFALPPLPNLNMLLGRWVEFWSEGIWGSPKLMWLFP